MTPLCVVLAAVSDGVKCATLFCFAGFPPLAVVVAFTYFARTQPDYLRSEDFQFNRIALSLLGEKGKPLPERDGENLTEAPPDDEKAQRLLLAPPDEPSLEKKP